MDIFRNLLDGIAFRYLKRIAVRDRVRIREVDRTASVHGLEGILGVERIYEQIDIHKICGSIR